MRHPARVRRLLLLLVAACSSSMEPWLVQPVAAHEVLMTAADSGTTSEGRVVLVSLENKAATTAYLRNCGGPAIGMQVFHDGTWVTLPFPAALCIMGPPTVQLAAGDALTFRRVLTASGHYRFIAGVATNAELTDEIEATSNSFSLP
ncbi:MAG TPA: hypothetical protein VKH19_08355 [Gemmatimonadaceae bacterium]|nr:hypothetical protein [Gemmatimonadaceae bacterium]